MDPLSIIKLFALAPWFDTGALHEDKFYSRYATDGDLPGHILLCALMIFISSSFFSCVEADLVVVHGWKFQWQREHFTSTVLTSILK